MKYCPVNDCNGDLPARCCFDCPMLNECPDSCERKDNKSCALWVEGQEIMEEDKWQTR